MQNLHFLRKPKPIYVILVSFFLFYASNVNAEVTATKNVKFSVDVSLLVKDGKFNPTSDTVYVKGWFNNWKPTNPMKAEGNNIYSVTIQINENTYNEYKYYISTPGAENNGMEKDYPLCSCGSRVLHVTVNDLILPVMHFNEADMKLVKSTQHFNFYCTSQEDAIIEDFAQKMEQKYYRITSALEISIPEKTDIRLYKSLKIFHTATGRPEDPDWAVGSAYGKKVVAMVSPTVIDFNGAIDLLVHEYTHIVNAWKTKVILPNWLNEGVATYYALMVANKNAIKDLISGPAGKPTLQSLENDFSNGGYGYSYVIAYFIAKKHGTHALANFVENMDYTAMGYSDKIAFQTAWHQFLDVYADENTKQNVKFSIDLTSLVQANKFNTSRDKVYVRGAFNGWSLSKQLIRESGNIYSLTIPLVQYFFYEYKFFIDAPGAENGGWEGNMNATTMGNRLLDLEGKTLILPVAGYNVITGIKPVAFSNIKLFVQNHSLQLSNFPSKVLIQVFQINGKKMLETQCADDQLTMPLPAGIYILKIGNFTRKFIVN